MMQHVASRDKSFIDLITRDKGIFIHCYNSVVVTPKSTLDRRNKFVICVLVNKTAQFFFLIACQCPEEEIVDQKTHTDDLFKEYGGVGEERNLL